MSNLAPNIESKDYYTVMIHFYRGELGRIMGWRQRLDITTNWAIVASTGIITFGLNSTENSHLVFCIANLLCLLLLIIEGRRYRYYDAFRARVRMLEAHFIMPVVMNNTPILQGDWRKLMAEDLVTPSFKISRLAAITRRFTRNYVWIFAIILLAWFLKLWLHHPSSHDLEGFFRILTSQSPLPAAAFLTCLAAFYSFLLFLLIHGIRMGRSSGEFMTGAMRRKKWLD